MPTPHNSAVKGDFAKTVLMPGDPLRAKFIAETFLENPRLVNNVRGVQGYTGSYKGVPVSLTGPSGSGKTTTAMRLREYLENLGVKVCMLSMDNFFLPLDQRPPEASDWESPYCVNRQWLIDDIHRLMDGELVKLPVYNFKNGIVGGYKPMQGDKDAIIIA